MLCDEGFKVANIAGLPIVVPDPNEVYKVRLIFGGRFNLPCRHHRLIVEELSHRAKLIARASGYNCEVVIWPVGKYDGQEVALPARHRKSLVQLAFGDLPHVAFRMDDLDGGGQGYTPTVAQYDALTNNPNQAIRIPLKQRLQVPCWPRQAFIVAGSDNATRAKVTMWEEGSWLFNEAPWIIITRPGHPVTDAPTHRTVIELDLNGCATDVVAMIRSGTSEWEEYVASETVAQHIIEHNLFR